MEKLGKELIFISQIKRDGSGTSDVEDRYIKLMECDVFKLTCLSLSNKTYIATAFNSFVVKLKNVSEDMDFDNICSLLDIYVSKGRNQEEKEKRINNLKNKIYNI